MVEEEKFRKELQELMMEHKEIDGKIAGMTKEPIFDQISVQRMKRRKLWLKDRIFYIQEFLYDDIIA